MERVTLLTLTFSTTVHFVLACVMSLYARHRVQYLCLACVNAIFFAISLLICFFSHRIAYGQPGVLHPLMLISLVAACYLQSIYPMSIPMPGYLQWRRMWKYATPALVLIAVYVPLHLLVPLPAIQPTIAAVWQNLFHTDLVLRLAALVLCFYYIINIFRLPHKIARSTPVPRHLMGYCTALGVLASFYYVGVAAFYSPWRLMVYMVLFSGANMYITFRELETIAQSMPRPDIQPVAELPTEHAKEKAESDDEDFNEANVHRFQRIQYWMQNHREEWTDNTFGRDRLCLGVGYNRHLVLQSVRSQGFNNVHDYINSYRIAELKRLVSTGKATTVSECMAAGFGTTKTVRTCFEKMTDQNFDDYLAQSIAQRRAALSQGPHPTASAVE